MKNYAFHKNIVLRNPLRPLNDTFSVDELKILFSEKQAREALFLSSPLLLKEYDKWMRGELDDKKRISKLVDSLLKYALRMHSRCTPFGLFAGCSMIEWADQNKIVLPKERLLRSTRLDMNYTCALSQELAKHEAIKPHLKFFANSSIYTNKGEIRYVEYFYNDNRRVHQISAVNTSTYLDVVLKKGRTGATLHELALTLVDDEIEMADAKHFIDQLCASQLLVSELEPAVTGLELLTQLISTLDKTSKRADSIELDQILSQLVTLNEALNQIDKNEVNDHSIYLNLADQLKDLGVKYDISKLFQTDYFKKAYGEQKSNSGSLSHAVQEKVKKALTVLNCMTKQHSNQNLDKFKKDFYERYEDAEIPLSEVMDNESGIGYAGNDNHSGDLNPLLNNLTLPYPISTSTNQIYWDENQSLLLKKLSEHQINKEDIIRITADDFDKTLENWKDLPDSIAVMFRHLGMKDDEDYIHLQNVGGSSAINLLGRFASGNNEIQTLVDEIANHEEELNPEAIIAEIVHLPESRTGNILMRPVFRKYEIPYLSKSSLTESYQVKLDDILVSVSGGEIRLRSKVLNKEIIPRLGNAHNYSYNALPVYQFLCDMQIKPSFRSGLGFSWGHLENEFKFLPRVEVEGVVVQFAKWKLNRKDIEELTDLKEFDAVRIEHWRVTKNIPVRILLAEGDNELLINLENKESVQMFINLVRKRNSIEVKEFVFDKDSGVVRNEQDDIYTNECIAILLKGKEENVLRIDKVDKDQFESKLHNIQRSFSIGSEWLYYKLYSGLKTGDALISEVIGPFAKSMVKKGYIDNWFFIRYNDPHPHIRVRYHFSDPVHIGKVISQFQTALIGSGFYDKIWKLQTDTYLREISRYGSSTMALSESLFFADSVAISKMLSLIEGEEGEEIRWLFAIRSIDDLLSAFEYGIKEKNDLMEFLKSSFSKEFNSNKGLKKQLDKRFRDNQTKIKEILNRENDTISDYSPLFVLLARKEIQQSQTIREILRIYKNGMNEISLDHLLSSYIHMLMNRLFKNRQRVVELVIYEFMWKVYKAEWAMVQNALKRKLA